MNKKIILILFGVLISLSYVYAAGCEGKLESKETDPNAKADSPLSEMSPAEQAAYEAAAKEAVAAAMARKAEAEAAARKAARYDTPLQDIGGVLSEASKIYGTISGNQYWLNKWGLSFSNQWEGIADDLANSVFSESKFMGKKTYCTEWIDNEGGPVSIIPGPRGTFAGHIEGRRAEAWIEENGQAVRTFIYMITLSINPQGVLKDSKEFVEAELYVNPGRHPIIFDATGTNVIRLQGTAGEYRRDGSSMIVIPSKEGEYVKDLYSQVCLDFSSSFEKFTANIRDDLMHGDSVICNSFDAETGIQTSETGILGIGVPEGSTKSAGQAGGSGGAGSASGESAPTGGGARIG